MAAQDCPFCDLEDRVVSSNEHAVAIRDQGPASPGHTLIVPKRHATSFFDLDRDEAAACFDLLKEQRRVILEEQNADGFNVGVNDGGAAGQTVQHAHVHLIPRYAGDHPDPRGGVRHILPTRR